MPSFNYILFFILWCAWFLPVLAEEALLDLDKDIKKEYTSFDNAVQKYNILFSLDSLKSSVQVFGGQNSQGRIIFLPAARELLCKKLAKKLSRFFSVYLLPNRTSPSSDVRFLGGSYSRYLEYYHTKLPVHRRRISKVKSPHIWDLLEADQFISKGQDTTVLITSFSLKTLLGQEIYRSRFPKVVLVSPRYQFLKEDLSPFLPPKKILWLGSSFEQHKLKKFQNKYGGNILSYSRSGRGIAIFFRNSQALTDVKNWILSSK